VCEPLVNFFTVALVKPAGYDMAPLTLHTCVGTAGYMPSPAVVGHRRLHTLYRDLPSLKPANATNPARNPVLLDVACGMRGMVTKARLDRNDQTDARWVALRPRTARECIIDALVDRLLLMCRAAHDDDLPRVYYEWVARPRGASERYVLHQSVDLAVTILELPSFEVTPTQVMTFKNFRYAGSSYFGIGSGLLPFSITPSEATAVQASVMLTVDRFRADAFDLGADPESGALAPGKVVRLRNLSGYIPQTWNEALSQLLGM
jgi:hypothetical protein